MIPSGMNGSAVEERHAHEVMEMMLASGQVYNRDSLKEEIRGRFGSGVSFYTCSMKGLTPDELIDFLAMRGKLSGTPDAFYFDAGNRCQH